MPKALRGAPEVDPDTHEVGKPYKHEHGRKYWHYFMRMDKHPKGWLHLYETPHGMICLYGKVMHHSLQCRRDDINLLTQNSADLPERYKLRGFS